ncbi:MAG: alpha/beta hydrolase [Lachnospiraceae bacterium]|nr:alpha/beta hydrolase [Lachnospiraceae bacterium]
MEHNLETNPKMIKAIKKMHAVMETPDIEKQRAAQENFGGILSKSRELTYQNFELGGIPAEWSCVERSHMKKYVILYCHGGGYTSGSFRYARSITNKLASSTSMDVLSFDYRLAPENPYPAALEDAMNVWDHLMYHGYGARDIIIAGDSAGGNLALALTLKLKEQGRLLPRGLVLFSPWTDLTMSGKSHKEKAELDPILSAEYLQRCRESYAPEMELKNPLISPVFGDFTGFPPTYIQVGTNEILLSDSTKLQRQLQKYHVPVKMEYYPGMWHVFQMSPLKNAYSAMDQVAEFIFDICR